MSAIVVVLTPEEEALAVQPSWVRAVKAVRERTNLSLAEAVDLVRSCRGANPDKVLQAAKVDTQGDLESAMVRVARLEKELKVARAQVASLRRAAKKMAKEAA